MSQLAQHFSQNQFCLIVEYLNPDSANHIAETHLAGFPLLMSLADRVQADDDALPLEIINHCPQSIEKIIHFAGKDRDITDFERFLKQTKELGQENLLLLSGDKLKNHQTVPHRTRYLESVNAVLAAKKLGGFHIGVAFNPFKYAWAEKEAQYFKLHKKIQAGADFIITQIGYDLTALQEVQDFLQQHQYPQKILACVMPLTFTRAQYMLKHKIAGITITSHVLKILTQEAQTGLTEAVYQRCALHILICKHLGFAGVTLSYCHQSKDRQRLETYLHQYQFLDWDACISMWRHLWQIDADMALSPTVEANIPVINFQQKIKYQFLKQLHETIFSAEMAQHIGHFVYQSEYWGKPWVTKTLLHSEMFLKHQAVGCEHCGQCRLHETLYVCPETCPKGLANGPCGGTHLDQCEFGDRKCIHSTKVQIAKSFNQEYILKEVIIPTIPVKQRGTSSWKSWFIDQNTEV